MQRWMGYKVHSHLSNREQIICVYLHTHQTPSENTYALSITAMCFGEMGNWGLGLNNLTLKNSNTNHHLSRGFFLYARYVPHNIPNHHNNPVLTFSHHQDSWDSEGKELAKEDLNSSHFQLRLREILLKTSKHTEGRVRCLRIKQKPKKHVKGKKNSRWTLHGTLRKEGKIFLPITIATSWNKPNLVEQNSNHFIILTDLVGQKSGKGTAEIAYLCSSMSGPSARQTWRLEVTPCLGSRTTFRHFHSRLVRMLAATWDRSWSCQPEHLYTPLHVTSASSQSGNLREVDSFTWQPRASKAGVPADKAGIAMSLLAWPPKITQCHFWYIPLFRSESQPLKIKPHSLLTIFQAMK